MSASASRWRRIHEATYGRLFAAGYDAMARAVEQAGLAERRHALLAEARGTTLEIGAGTGGNLEHYTNAVTALVLTEPSAHMARRLRERRQALGRAAEVIVAPAERLPLPDDSMDTAVATLVLCTVPDPAAVLAELGRVLRPGGRLLFLEHVRSDSPRSAAWQDRLQRPWHAIGNGCHCNRATLRTIDASPLRVERVARGEMPKAPPIVRPLIWGAAVAS